MAKRRGQWFGDRVAHTTQQVPDTTDVVQLLPPALALESIRDIVFERCVLTFGVSRILTNTITDVEWMAYLGNVADGSVIPLEALNPRSAADTTLAHASIMQFGQLPVPPVIKTFDSAGAVVNSVIDGAVLTKEYDFDVKRSVQRGAQGIFLTMAASVSDVIRLNVAWRTYYTYA